MDKPTQPGYWWVRFKPAEPGGYSFLKKMAYVESLDKYAVVRLLTSPDHKYRIDEFQWEELISPCRVKGEKTTEKVLDF